MLPASRRLQIWIGIGLSGLLIVTRGYHFATLDLLPSASYAVFLLAGVYLAPRWVFPALWSTAAFVDLSAVTVGGVSAFCVSPAYAFLIPAYGGLWLAGRYWGATHRWSWARVPSLAASLLLGVLVCELLASGGFYFFSGRFPDPTIAGFGPRLATYFPSSLESVLFYVGAAAVIHVAAVLVSSTVRRHQTARVK